MPYRVRVSEEAARNLAELPQAVRLGIRLQLLSIAEACDTSPPPAGFWLGLAGLRGNAYRFFVDHFCVEFDSSIEERSLTVRSVWALEGKRPAEELAEATLQ